MIGPSHGQGVPSGPWSTLAAAVRATAVAAFFALDNAARAAGAASAEPTTIDVSDQPIILIQHAGPLQVRTWDRQQIQIDTSGGEKPDGRQAGLQASVPWDGGPDASYPVQIPAASLPMAQDGGPPIQLGPEEFPVSTPAGVHDTIRIQLPRALSDGRRSSRPTRPFFR